MSKKGQTRIRHGIGLYVWVQVLDRGLYMSEKGLCAIRKGYSWHSGCERKTIVQDRNNTEKHEKLHQG